MLKLYDIVVLKEDDPKTRIKRGTEGTIVYIHGNGEAYTVEFFDSDGDTFKTSFDKEFTESELQKK
ncbi:MAG: DUF4926 domain-containing protein [Oscillospiraceae bacterium]|nr:DUF4926 domain-containing protein [Oscillospiraceae bacterium]